MAVYEYRCEQDGDFDVRQPMGQAPDRTGCPVCGSPAPRRFSPPSLQRTSPAVRAGRSLEEQSRHEPEVVDAVPPAPRREHGRTVDAHPLWKRLPRG